MHVLEGEGAWGWQPGKEKDGSLGPCHLVLHFVKEYRYTSPYSSKWFSRNKSASKHTAQEPLDARQRPCIVLCTWGCQPHTHCVLHLSEKRRCFLHPTFSVLTLQWTESPLCIALPKIKWVRGLKRNMTSSQSTPEAAAAWVGALCTKSPGQGTWSPNDTNAFWGLMVMFVCFWIQIGRFSLINSGKMSRLFLLSARWQMAYPVIALLRQSPEWH